MGRFRPIFNGQLEITPPLSKDHSAIFNDPAKYEALTKTCYWRITDDGKFLEWNQKTPLVLSNEVCIDGTGKAYDEWLKYILNTFLRPWGYQVNGAVRLTDGDYKTNAKITVIDNEMDIWEYYDIYNRKKYQAKRLGRLIDSKIERLEHENASLKEENQQLTRQVELLQMELKYRPDGEGAKEAKEHFESLIVN